MIEGKCTYKNKYGDITIGEMKDNYFDGKCTVYHKSGEIFNVVRSNGELEDLEKVTSFEMAWFGNGQPV